MGNTYLEPAADGGVNLMLPPLLGTNARHCYVALLPGAGAAKAWSLAGRAPYCDFKKRTGLLCSPNDQAAFHVSQVMG